MDSLRSVCKLKRIDKVPNWEIVERCKKEVRVGEKMSRALLRWYGHVERMEGDRMVRRVYEAKVEGKRKKGRPRRRWRECVQERVESKGLNMREAGELAKDRGGWRRWYMRGKEESQRGGTGDGM